MFLRLGSHVALQLHGGNGFTVEHYLHLWLHAAEGLIARYGSATVRRDGGRRNDPLGQLKGTAVTTSTPAPLDLAPFVDAASVAIVGASDDYNKVGGRVLHYLQRYGYSGVIYPVNPKRTEVLGLTAYPSVADLPEAADLAVLALPVAAVADAVAECGRRGIGAAVVFASGYSETGAEGERLQEELGQMAREHGVRLLGPNCVGVVGAQRGLTASMMTGLDQDRFDLRDDGIAFVSQSGAVGAFLFNMAQGLGIGIGTFISTGNEVDITLGEATEALTRDEGTRAVLGYIEGVRDAGGFRAALESAQQQGIPVGFMKVGRTSAGAEAAASHTGSLAGEDTIYDGLFAQYGVTRTATFDELLDLGRIMTLPQPAGSRATILTISGGAGILSVDAAAQYGVEVPRWEGEWGEKMAALLPGFASTTNPIDTTGAIASDPGMLRDVLDLCEAHPESDVTVLILGNMEKVEDRVCELLADAVVDHATPLVVVWVGGSGRPMALLAERGIAAFEEPVRAMRAVGRWMGFARRQRELAAAPAPREPYDLAPAVALLDAARKAGKKGLDEAAGKEFLAAAGMPVVQELEAGSPAEAVAAAQQLGFPVVLKLLSDEVHHKTELGVVRLGLAGPDDVEQAAREVLAVAEELKLADRRVTVQPFVSSETEIIVGMKHDPAFGPVVLLGIGGVLTEIAADVAVRVPPFDLPEAHRMIEDLQYVALLEGPRGRVAVDKDELAQVLVDFGHLSLAVSSHIESMEINPFMVMSTGNLQAVDALVLLSVD